MFVFHFSVTSEERAKGRAEPGRVLCDVSRLQSAADDSLLNGALVLCNPATSGPSDSDARDPDPQGGRHLPAAAPQQCGDEDQSHSKGATSQLSEECRTANVGETVYILAVEIHGVFWDMRRFPII